MIPLRDNIKSRTIPVVNWLLLLANIAVFLREVALPHPTLAQDLIVAWGVVPARLLADPFREWPTLFTSLFLHGGWGHILGNMMYLWIFGDNVEDRLGHVRYLVFYLTTGVVAALTQVYAHPSGGLPLVGASGAIAGALGAYFVLYPKAKVETLIPLGFFSRVVEVPAYFFLGFWFLIQYLQGLSAAAQRRVLGDTGGVAWWAHLGGFLAGLLLVGVFKKKRGR